MKRGNGSNLQVNAELLKDRKVRQRWLLASAVALSMLGAGAMVNVGNASADTIGNNTPTTQIAQSSKMTASSKKADVKTDVATPTVNQPYTGDRIVTGRGTAGNTIVVYDDLKNEIGRAIVGEDGEYSAEIKAEYELFAGETISVVQIDADGKESSPVNMVIQDRVPTPVIDQPYEGDRTVIGIGTPGYTVIIYDDLENEIGRATVDQYGIFRADIHIGYNLYAGETITAIQRDASGKESEPVSITVKAKLGVPFIEQPHVGDKRIEGRGTPGYTVEVYNERGDRFGIDRVDEFGDFEVPVPPEYSLYEGEEIIAFYVDENGNKGDKATAIVKAKEEAVTIE
ncbi:hypothetical protein GBP19_01715 [Pediococcus acidilactici]|uniref:Ig-like domain-containing protein n=1 Tax=Pediococcus acidilactici TaxID=1254 RepID=UPI001327BB0C|nr:Ig-like domain-containing protein [Pediococcus acidilactici]KAF0334362.1 hypothetical protein GBO38_03850 [Pediococcus acidilactici]KAF0347702.1 hypothetical protein GBO44_08525 [Pediococcus acidilactici]KAF0393767.1 hypothetical protein GBO68_03845 [Pediococcus acidilactici]KAF0397990.1 hypothetical protein GBO72_01740 [Pediococcus acidilactici]KAF0410146.1 hypothetical protein GBO78_03855 [Pediococcus acidilactici]